MLAALEKNPYVVMGSAQRDIDCERVWRAELDKRLRSKQAQNTGVCVGCVCKGWLVGHAVVGRSEGVRVASRICGLKPHPHML